MIAVAVYGAFILAALAAWLGFAVVIYGAFILTAWGSTED
jgi:hypothetical protein